MASNEAVSGAVIPAEALVAESTFKAELHRLLRRLRQSAISFAGLAELWWKGKCCSNKPSNCDWFFTWTVTFLGDGDDFQLTLQMMLG